VKILFIGHAENRLKERGIQKKHVRQVILNPEIKYNSEDKERIIVHKKIGKKELKVIYEKISDSSVRVITAMYRE
jgi:hypothetical protein